MILASSLVIVGMSYRAVSSNKHNFIFGATCAQIAFFELLTGMSCVPIGMFKEYLGLCTNIYRTNFMWVRLVR
jgi:hypothetical protein